MDLLTFLTYDLITFILKLIFIAIVFYIFKDKLADLLLDRQLDKTFDSLMNKSILDIDNDDDSDFVDSIHIIDNEESQTNTNNSQNPTKF